MPKHEYRCKHCGEQYIFNINIKDELPEKVYCPQCKQPMNKVWNNPIVIYKGYDWTVK